MERKLLFTIFALFILVFAVAGWTVDGMRWAAKPVRRRPRTRRVPAWA